MNQPDLGPIRNLTISKPADYKAPPPLKKQIDLSKVTGFSAEPAASLTAGLPKASDAFHFLSRISFGPSGVELKKVENKGWEAYLEEQLNWESINDNAVENYVRRRFPTVNKKIPNLIRADNYRGYYELKQATIYRALYSKRQLREVMIQFWSNHFSIHQDDDWQEYLKLADDREVIRPHALGSFRDLLAASTHSPSMLIYLDNHVNFKDDPNENYARELLELHTMGADNGYTQEDVVEVARCFTGASLEWRGTRQGLFRFYPSEHDNGSKQVLGTKIPAGQGAKDIDDVVDILAGHPNTASYISYKLCRHFVADDPPKNVVEAVKNTFLSTDGDIREMLRTLFSHNAFWNNSDEKFRRPMEWMIAMLRAWPPKFENNKKRDEGLLWFLYGMGQVPFGWAPPDGYPDEAASWANTNGFLNRWNLGFHYGHGWMYGIKDQYQNLLNKAGDLSPRQWVDYLEENLLRRPISDEDRKKFVTYAAHGGNPDKKRSGWMEQRIVKGLIAMMINSPYFQYR
jgi:hypothetical protein